MKFEKKNETRICFWWEKHEKTFLKKPTNKK
jgi:hypothetical protein